LLFDFWRSFGMEAVVMQQDRAVHIGDADFEKEVLQAHVPVVVDYWAPWCGPCRMAAPVLEKIAQQYDGKLKVCKINIDEHRQVAGQYGIMSVPTLHIFKDGSLVDQMTGVSPRFEADLKKKIEPHLE
jgi:thioredoxin 1